jgi:hypothetical protein
MRKKKKKKGVGRTKPRPALGISLTFVQDPPLYTLPLTLSRLMPNPEI